MGGIAMEPQSEKSRHAALAAHYRSFFTRRTTAVCGASSPSMSWLTQYGAIHLTFGTRRPQPVR
jgi:hypothetical protein